MLFMKLIIRVFAVALLPALILVVASIPLAGAAPADLYKTKCVMCHGADGSGNTTMGKRLGLHDLRAPATQGQPDAKLMETIENGKGKMPSQKGRLSKDEIRHLVGYLRELAKKH
jgi:cytochrome c6